MSFINRLLTSGIRKHVEQCIHATSKIVALRLFDRYSARYGREEAIPISVAVVNELFGVQPGTERAKEFVAKNPDLVRRHLEEIKQDAEVVKIISILVHTRMNFAGHAGTMTPEMILWASKLRELGILAKESEITLPRTQKALTEALRAFELKVLLKSSP